MWISFLVYVGALISSLVVCGNADDDTLPRFEPQDSSIKAQITCVGSDTMGDLMVKWSQAFGRHNPGVTFSLESKGSATAIPGLLGGRDGKYARSSIGYSIRSKEKELEEFKARRGYPLTTVNVAIQRIQDFPDGRFFYFFVDLPPTDSCKPEIAEFIRFVLSREGQAIVKQAGFEPISPKTASEELKKLRLDD